MQGKYIGVWNGFKCYLIEPEQTEEIKDGKLLVSCDTFGYPEIILEKGGEKTRANVEQCLAILRELVKDE